MIEKKFHRVWIKQSDDDVIPEVFERYWLKLQWLHPGFEFHTWYEPPEEMQCRAVFDTQTTDAGRSDVVRYEVVSQFGGVYLDTDVEPLRSFADLFDDDRAFAAWEDNRMICPTVIGAPAHHYAMQLLLDKLPAWSARRPDAPPNQQTGPHFLTAHWRFRKDVSLMSPESFYPVHWSEKSKLNGSYPKESYAVHHWSASWLPDGPPQRSKQ